MRKTKVVCTLGPATANEEMVRELFFAGMDAARFNFSHGTHESHLEMLNTVKRAARFTGRAVATILDTKGPEIRLKTFENKAVILEKGAAFTLTTREVAGTNEIVSVSYPNLHRELDLGQTVLIDDGLVEIRVTDIKGQDIACQVVTGGEISNNKSINIPGAKISLPALTEKDESDIIFGIEHDFDFIAASFIRRASDVEAIRRVLEQNGGEKIKIISKIENREGVDNLDEILAVSDGLMVARGDLGVEIPACEVPPIQKEMITKCNALGKTVITATQMLDSMIRNPRPTRAEVSDVANAVFDGTSCVMLSGETASGKYPIESIRTMISVINSAEKAIDYAKLQASLPIVATRSTDVAIAHACCLTARDLNARAILAATTSGFTARMIAMFMPECPIAAMTTDEKVRRQLAVTRGVLPLHYSEVNTTDEVFAECVKRAKEAGLVVPGDTVVITAGVPIGEPGTTNLIKAQMVK